MNGPETITITPIGVVHCSLQTPEEAPRYYTISDVPGTLEIFPPYLEAMDGIEAGQTLVVLFWLHKARRDQLKVYPRGDRSRGLRGVFATRSPIRPNPIALSEFKVLKVQGNLIEVTGVDVINGTPIVDIKSLGERKDSTGK
ncbi:MAG TPA: tRNA (N6-threonylcarbamoyladenosine(37)-N6)-methyltransferase TrmO [Desulfobulbaceae bacterium]|nr:tRNA (N6-threonylcarbamoyladenosine(37)-N6)-methyltransferase TrmO [Desulfobulbaceae bacterium]